MQSPPGWCSKYEDCWRTIVQGWQTPAAYVEHRERRAKRLGEMARSGVSHHQGSVNLGEFMETWVCLCSTISYSAGFLISLLVTMFSVFLAEGAPRRAAHQRVHGVGSCSQGPSESALHHVQLFGRAREVHQPESAREAHQVRRRSSSGPWRRLRRHQRAHRP